MAVVALVSNKGGAGKTTLAMNLAAGLDRRGTTMVVDADPQQSALHWARVGELSGHATVPVIEAGEDLPDRTRDAARRHEHVIIDCPPSIQAEQTRAALEVTDLALVPVLPSPLDLWATTYIAEAVARARSNNPELRAYLVVNQVEPRTTLSRVLGRALGELEIPALETPVRRRTIYRNCLIEGRTVYGIGARGRAAVTELEQLLTEVF